MPAASAGLLRFYEEKTSSIIKIRPEFIIVTTAVLIVSILLAHVFLTGII
ncbi:MAG: Sec61beta family [Thermoproteota archaeon]|nr:Sec61beta family [Thermoproteota archaeon]